jgi:hypothetical protein
MPAVVLSRIVGWIFSLEFLIPYSKLWLQRLVVWHTTITFVDGVRHPAQSQLSI